MTMRGITSKIVNQLTKQSWVTPSSLCVPSSSVTQRSCCFSLKPSLLYYDQDNHKNTFRSPHKEVPTVVGATIPEFLWSNLGKYQNLPAFECGLTGKVYKHGEVYKYSRAFATALLQSGLKQGDVVGVMMLNSPDFPVVVMGILEAGLIASTANPNYTEDELTNQMNDCGAKCLVTSSQFASHAQTVKRSSKTLKSVVVVSHDRDGCVPEGTHSFAEMIKVNSTGTNFLKGSQIDTTETTAFIPYSSGTTGPPKGVVLSHSNLTTNLLQQLCPTLTTLRKYEDTRQQDKLMGILPFFHIYGFNVILTTTIFMGCHTLCIPKFEPKGFVQAFRSHKPSVAHLVTPIINFIVHSGEFTKTELEPVRTIVAGAAPIGPHLIESLLKKADKYLFFQEAYGMTEMSPISHMLPPSSKNKKLGSCGQVVSSTIAKIVDVESGELLGPNQRGELWVKGSQVMKGYLKNEKATKSTIDDDGWLRTGDIGYIDEDGFCFIVDRLKELIKVNGLQVAPAELEDILRKIPQVGDCAVIGIPSDSSGELPRAYIVRKDGPLLTTDAVHSFLKDKVSRHKQLAGGIEFVSQIPRAVSGKILRRELKSAYLDNNKGTK